MITIDGLDPSGAPSETAETQLFLPKGRAPEGIQPSGRTLSPELRRQATDRLRFVGITYSTVYFLADFFPQIVARRGDLAHRFQHPAQWMPAVFSIVGGLLVALLVPSRRLSWDTKVNLGLIFEVVASYGIALSMYLGISPAEAPMMAEFASPSWVAVWMLAYSIVVPAPPGRALLALIGSASAPPVVAGLILGPIMGPRVVWTSTFFFTHAFPYLVCAGLAYVAARTVFGLGKAVTRARELGSYRLVERLSEGGMGEVWRASHQLLARGAAIKFIRPDAIAQSNPEETQRLVRRFELEAHTTASLTSAHTVDLYDFGVTEAGSFYYVMELLDGIDCDHLVRRFGPQPAARVIHLMTQVCDSLEEAHSKGLIHRDVKPANVYVCRSGMRCDFVKVLDFGLVVHQQAPASSDLRLTLPQQAVGTPAFMAPEMALGQDVDGRADLYALGCVGYWLLTGKPVFTGSSLYEVISNHLHTTPDPPSRHAPHPVPADLDVLVLQCLEKDRDRRPRSARELGHRMGDVAVSDPWSDEQAAAWWAANLDPRENAAESSPHKPIVALPG